MYSFKDRFEGNVTLSEKFQTAVSVSLALVYYMRLDDHHNGSGEDLLLYRTQYVTDLQRKTGQSLRIDDALNQEVREVIYKLQAFLTTSLIFCI